MHDFVIFFNRVVEFPSSRNAQKRNKKIDKGISLDARPEHFVIEFLSSHYREALNQRKKKSRKKKS
jgi:hypothetical protein